MGKVQHCGRWLKKFLKISSLIFVLLCLDYFFDNEEQKDSLEKFDQNSCDAKIPKENEIIWDQSVWQILKTTYGSLRFFNAYLDTRLNQSVVRVNSNGPKIYIQNRDLFCQFWYNSDKSTHPKVVKASDVQSMVPVYFNWNIKKYDPSYLILCPVEKDKLGKYPSSVSVTLKPCDQATNNLKIIDNQPPNGVKKEFGYCGKYINYKDRKFGMRFIEWIHALRILGNDKVYMYKRQVHPDVEDILKYFEDKNMLEVEPFHEPSGSKWIPYYASLIQINLFTDCFYKIRNLYKFIAVFDSDEILMPTQTEVTSWHEMMGKIVGQSKNFTDVYSFKMINYPHLGQEDLIPDIPPNNYMLQHVQRTKIFSQWVFYYIKSIIVPDRVEWIHQHEAVQCFGGKCIQRKIHPSVAHVNHYRAKVKRGVENVTVTDSKIWKIKGQLIKDVEITLKDLKFEP